ncbi:hypothetical protein N0V88_007488 [Collariella sp. IMI 366227]|nr:hypothetical protein N0V88_007488 [Collariella sp. IMI 366227]
MADRLDPQSITINDVIFTEATPHQRILSWELNGASWAPPMTIPEYVGRETTLSQTALSTPSATAIGTKYYILHRRTDPNNIISACEVTGKKVVFKNSAVVHVADAYSIASVFTNPRFRGLGMAGYMLKRVQQEVDGWAECGHCIVVVVLGEGVDVAVPEGVVMLKEGDVPELCERDVAAVKARFGKLEVEEGKTHVAFLPTVEQLTWHFARDAYVCKTLLGREVVYRGAKIADGNSWIYWDHDLREKKLKVLRIVTQKEDSAEKRKEDVKKLLLAAMREAKKWELVKVLVWNPTKEASVVATELWEELGPKVQVVFDEREDGSIPSLRWKGDKRLEGVVWKDNEYYAWC